MSRKYKFHNPKGIYFVSFATCFWVDVFTRQCYFSILEESLQYCREVKNMLVYAYCFMPNHVHLIFQAANENPSDLMRDYKSFTAKRILKELKTNPKESRKQWILGLLAKNQPRQLWQHHNHPIELWSNGVIQQKIHYIHMNPVKTGFVTVPEDWKYSSAKNYTGKTDFPLLIDI